MPFTRSTRQLSVEQRSEIVQHLRWKGRSRREIVLHLHEQGDSVRSIAAAVGVALSTVQKDLRAAGEPLEERQDHAEAALDAAPPRSSPEPALDRLDTLYELLDLARGPSWHDLAACRRYPGIDFFPDEPGDTRTPLLVCEECPVRERCAAAGAGEEFGIWGGVTRPSLIDGVHAA